MVSWTDPNKDWRHASRVQPWLSFTERQKGCYAAYPGRNTKDDERPNQAGTEGVIKFVWKWEFDSKDGWEIFMLRNWEGAEPPQNNQHSNIMCLTIHTSFCLEMIRWWVMRRTCKWNILKPDSCDPGSCHCQGIAPSWMLRQLEAHGVVVRFNEFQWQFWLVTQGSMCQKNAFFDD